MKIKAADIKPGMMQMMIVIVVFMLAGFSFAMGHRLGQYLIPEPDRKNVNLMITYEDPTNTIVEELYDYDYR